MFATTDDDRITVVRSGDAIFVLAGSEYGDSPEILLGCVGGAPTVHNTDLVSIENAPTDFSSSVEIDLSSGLLAPGATPEPDGSSEIEIRAKATGDYGILGISGTPGPDAVDLGQTPSGGFGINLNPAAEASPDVDVELVGPEFPVILGRDGADTIRAQGTPGFAGPYGAPFFASGGRGNDLIAGGTAFNFFRGGKGRDALFGSVNKDVVLPELGRDRAVTGPGPDRVIAGEGDRDRVNCGGGKDQAVLDREDKGNSCQRRNPRELRVELTEPQEAGVGATFEFEGF